LFLVIIKTAILHCAFQEIRKLSGQPFCRYEGLTNDDVTGIKIVNFGKIDSKNANPFSNYNERRQIIVETFSISRSKTNMI